MKRHLLKTHPGPFALVKLGQKRHEVRINDREFETGDEVVLQEWTPDFAREHNEERGYSGDELRFTIGAVSAGGTWGLPVGLCVFTLLEPTP